MVYDRSMEDGLRPRIAAQCIAEPDEWETIRRYCFETREPIGRVLVLGALAYIKQQKPVRRETKRP